MDVNEYYTTYWREPGISLVAVQKIIYLPQALSLLIICINTNKTLKVKKFTSIDEAPSNTIKTTFLNYTVENYYRKTETSLLSLHPSTSYYIVPILNPPSEVTSLVNPSEVTLSEALRFFFLMGPRVQRKIFTFDCF